MKVKLLNKERAKDLFKDWGEFAKVCYDTKTDTPEKIGKHCKNSGHNSGSRSNYIVFRVDEVPRFLIDQSVRAEIGVCKNVQSFRYVNKNSFAYEIPSEILDNEELLARYHEHMMRNIELYEDIQTYVKNKTGSNERANEQARYVLPMATHSSYVIGFTVEALIHYMHIRLCVRTEDVHRKLAIAMKKEILEVLPELKNDLVPQCQYLLWCPENKKDCAYPRKEELIEILKEARASKKDSE